MQLLDFLPEEYTEASLGEFYDQLARHDWWYDMSDDHGVWKKGSAGLQALTDISKQSPAHLELMQQYANHVFNQAPKPERPTD